MCLRSGVDMAVVWASSCSSDLTPRWELPFATHAAIRGRKGEERRVGEKRGREGRRKVENLFHKLCVIQNHQTKPSNFSKCLN